MEENDFAGYLLVREVTDELLKNKPVFIGWTDGTTHYDILFTFLPEPVGHINSGLKAGYMAVSIMQKGAFAFRICGDVITPDYLKEKTNTYSPELAEFLTALRRKLYLLQTKNA